MYFITYETRKNINKNNKFLMKCPRVTIFCFHKTSATAPLRYLLSKLTHVLDVEWCVLVKPRTTKYLSVLLDEKLDV